MSIQQHHPPAQSQHRRMVWVFPGHLRAIVNSAPTLQMTSCLRSAGWRVDLLVGAKVAKPRTGDIDGITVCEFPLPAVFVVKQAIYHLPVLRYLARGWSTIDVVFFASVSLPWMLLLRAVQSLRYRVPLGHSARLSRARPLFVMDTRTMPMSRATPRDRLRNLYTDGMNRLANRYVDGQTAITPGMADIYRIPASKLLGCWPSGVDLDLFSPSMATRRWPQGDESVEIVYIGTLSPDRDLIRLCEAVRMARLEGMKLRLTLIGDGPDTERLAAVAADSDDAVRVMPRIAHEKMPELLATMHVGALPFPDRVEFQVSSPIKLFEYLAAGMPVVATKVRCHTEVIKDRQCVFWAQDSSREALLAALRGLWTKRNELPDYGRAAAELAKDHTWAASADHLARAFEKGLAGARLSSRPTGRG